jgi:peptidoglycan hydrolase-like protein with peptidoglycan-binding domain
MSMKLGISILVAALLAASNVAAQVGIVGALTHEYTITPGRSYEGSIDIDNSSDTAQEVKAYQSDYFFYADGSTLYGEPGDLPRSNARWMSLSPKQVTIPPKETVTINFIIQVPDDATLTGTYWSLVMVEPVPLSSPESTSSDAKPGLGVNQVLRYGVQIVTQVGETGTRQLKFSQLKLVVENGKRSLLADVENSGERWLKGSFYLDLYDAKGGYVGKFESGQKRMYPQTSVRYSLDLVGVANGSYKALIVVDCGGDDVFGVNVNLVLKD